MTAASERKLSFSNFRERVRPPGRLKCSVAFHIQHHSLLRSYITKELKRYRRITVTIVITFFLELSQHIYLEFSGKLAQLGIECVCVSVSVCVCSSSGKHFILVAASKGWHYFKSHIVKDGSGGGITLLLKVD